MLRPSSLPHARAALAAGSATLALLLACGVAAAPADAAGRTESARAGSAARGSSAEQPLVPRIHSISPDYVPDKGPVVVRGTVTNDSTKTWTSLNVHGFMGSTPITTNGDLAEAQSTPLTADVGPRITVPGTFDSIASLAPGETKSFTIRLPHRTLPVSSPGVYWFGVHVLGNNGNGAARQAVGRDRTFLAYVPASAAQGQQESTALVVPVRAAVTRGPDGTVVDPTTWEHSLADGPLHDVADTGTAAAGAPLTWLVDPGVADVVRRLAHGNPPRTLSAPDGGAQGDQSPSSSPSTAGTGSGASTASGASATAPSASARHLAKQWLTRMHALLGTASQEVLGLPYGDLAVEPAVDHDPALLGAAFRRSAHALHAWGLSETPAVAPPSGRTTPGAVAALPHTADVLLTDTGVVNASQVVDRLDGHRLVLASSATVEGGPGPVNEHSSLAFRQRVLADAALRLLQGGQPLVVELPEGLQRRIHPSFFSGLSVPWMRLTTLADVSSRRPPAMDGDQLRPLPSDQPTLGPRLYDAADDLLAHGETLQSVLSGRHQLRRRLFEEVTGNASYAAQEQPLIALSRMRVVADWVRRSLDSIDLAAPESVTLASASGHFSVLVSNGLDVPIKVKVRARADPHVTISGGETVDLAPHGLASVLLTASTHQRGVHNVVLELTSTGGRPLGASDHFPMRAEQVSGLIWVIIGAGLGLLFAAIAIRLTRRILRARAT